MKLSELKRKKILWDGELGRKKDGGKFKINKPKLDIVNDFLQRAPRVHGIRKALVCKDGFTMSIQASDTHYCSPQANDQIYSRVEVGFPSKREQLLMKYAENAEKPTGTVYGQVPVDIVARIIEKHGGIDWQKIDVLQEGCKG